MDQSAIRSTAAVLHGDQQEPAPDELIEAMVGFEARYGGLFYRVFGGNGMEHGLDGDASGYHTSLGLAFGGILEGDWTWRVDVLLDGSTAMGPGQWPHRIIDSPRSSQYVSDSERPSDPSTREGSSATSASAPAARVAGSKMKIVQRLHDGRALPPK